MRYSRFPWCFWESTISSILYSSCCLMILGGGGLGFSCEGNMPWWYGVNNNSLKTVWIPCHVDGKASSYADSLTFLVI